MDHRPASEKLGFWRSRAGFALCAVLGVAGLYLLFEHRDHATQWFPYLLLLACPLMHVFMHRGHHHHDPDRDVSRAQAEKSHAENTLRAPREGRGAP